MKKLSLFTVILLVTFAFSACNSSCEDNKKATNTTTTSIEQDKTKVSELLDELAMGVESGNIDAIKKVWCPKEHTLLLGTENSEKLEGWKQIEAAFKGQFNALSDMLIAINDQEVKVSPDQNTAWFFEELSYNFVENNKAVSYDGIRFTGVFVKNEKGVWKLVQGHMSIPTNIENAK